MSIVRSLKVTLWRVVGGGAGASEPEEKWSWPEFGRKLVQALPYIAITIMLVSWMEDAGWLRGFETSHLDTMIRLWGSPKISKNITIVEINEQDYMDRFDGTSPLDKKTLLKLIGYVEKYHPRVIGVDIDTSDWFAACERHHDQKPAQCTKDCEGSLEMLGKLRREAKKDGTIIVWAAVPRTPHPPLKLIPRPELESDVQGVPRFPVDEDGTVRHFDGRVEVEKGTAGCTDPEGEKCYVPTFARAIYERYTGYSPEAKKKLDERVIFNFHGDRYQFPIINAKQFFPEEVKKETRTKEEIDTADTRIENRRNAQFVDQVVLIGGSFPEARDEYFTPMGLMQGVELNALAIQTDISKGGMHDVNKIAEYFIDWGVSILLVFVFYRLEDHPLRALLISMGFVILVAPLASRFSFNTTVYWFNFVPIAVGVVLHQFSDMAEGRVKVQRELEKLKELRREQERVEVDVATVEELAVSEIEGAGSVDRTVENKKVRRAASGAA